jgi:hypothetical protein
MLDIKNVSVSGARARGESGSARHEGGQHVTSQKLRFWFRLEQRE